MAGTPGKPAGARRRKVYDQAYFDTWYRQRGMGGGAALSRKVGLAVAMAEYHLGRPLQSVLDVGCGEGAWLAPLRRLRPGVRYLGVDASEYAIARHGARRNLHWLPFGDLASLTLPEPVDLLVCADVMHYLEDAELKRGLREFPRLCDGVAFLELFAEGDDIVGDTEELHWRPASWYRSLFARHGFRWAGPHCYLSAGLAARATAMELP
ncbi:class I SAM-dependent methyltransferase [Arenimonas fontis]|uniref:Class I SAM-dependent methyltransferase n=1 Tax=Arenimonas fontis TaxID=2608255 RepID=A0A5B2ZF05_9GAMM|nr:class I SAM-dependent methyltransferase [Arenimonas fontis]KAA2285790.1 class I SAM-dependent methyltransferase [Arenimonas fontis]